MWSKIFSEQKKLYGLALILALILGLCLPSFLDWMVDSGHRIAQEDLRSDYAVALVWSVFLGGSILFWPVSAKDKQALMLIWIIKVLVVLGFMLVYESHYGLDSYGYFSESRAATLAGPSENRIESGTEHMVRLAWLHQKIIPDSYHALKVSCALMGLIAVIFLYRAMVCWLGREDQRILFFFGLFPSILFWGSILGKDPIALLGIALYTWGGIHWVKHKKSFFLILCLLGVLVSAFMRFWLGIILMGPLMFLVYLTKKQALAQKWLLLGGAGLIFLYYFSNFQVQFHVRAWSEIFTATRNFSYNFSEGGSAQQMDLSSTLKMVLYLPLAVFTTLFRPFPGEVLNLFGFLSGVENVFLFIFFLKTISVGYVNLKKDLKEPLVRWMLSFVLLWLSFYSFICYQNLGTSVRYRLQMLPLFLMLLLYFNRQRQSCAAS